MLPRPLSRAIEKVAPHLYYELRDRRRIRRASRRTDVHAVMKRSQREILVRLAQGQFAVDVGAHKGNYCFELARVASKVIAFEPNPELARRLTELLRPSPYDVEVRCCALSNYKGTAELRVPVQRSGSATLEVDNEHVNRLAQTEAVRTLTVRVDRLDDIGLGAIDVMKIDVEGHQLPLLQGAEQTLLRHKPDVFIEIDESQKPGAIEAVDARFAELGYQGYFLLGPAMLPVSLFRKEAFHSSGTARHGRVRINDFFYFHSTKLADAERRLEDIIFYPVP